MPRDAKGISNGPRLPSFSQERLTLPLRIWEKTPFGVTHKDQQTTSSDPVHTCVWVGWYKYHFELIGRLILIIPFTPTGTGAFWKNQDSILGVWGAGAGAVWGAVWGAVSGAV